MTQSSPRRFASLDAAVLAPLFMAGLGGALLLMAQSQPAWLDGRIGPGLFARWLSGAVIAMSLIWLAAAIFGRDRAVAAANRPNGPSAVPGLALLGGVVAFALALPSAGLAIACAVSAGIVGLGAGNRRPGEILFSLLIGAAIALGLGLTLLPPGTRLWPAV